MDGDMFRVFGFHLLKYILFGAGACLATSQAIADAFIVTLENPGVQQSSLFVDPSNTGVYQENFDSYDAKVHNHLNFDGSSKYGSYDTSLIQNADVYGGAGGTGSYFDLNTNLGGPSSTTLTLKQPERYFGLWWSAGDPNNVLQFYSGNTLVATFHSSDAINFINSESSTLQHQYLGNPNNGGDSGEYFAYLNFYADPKDQSVTFDRIVFCNSGNSGFESDNHTIAASYTSISGTPVPEPSTFAMLGVGSVALIGMIAIRSRRRAVV